MLPNLLEWQGYASRLPRQLGCDSKEWQVKRQGYRSGQQQRYGSQDIPVGFFSPVLPAAGAGSVARRDIWHRFARYLALPISGSCCRAGTIKAFLPARISSAGRYVLPEITPGPVLKRCPSPFYI